MISPAAPLVQVRVIGPADQAARLIVYAAEHARRIFGGTATYRTQTRTARRHGYIRAYLTVTRKENP